MENAARALEIAAGVLLGVMLFALVAFLFNSIRSSPIQEGELLTAEQLAKFNMEYEVYNKQAMYGVDVISCLNKVISYDKKYIDEDAFLAGKGYGSEYVIDVEVTINSPLQESIELYIIENGKETSAQGKDSEIDLAGPDNVHGPYTMDEMGFDFPEDTSYTNYTKNTKVRPEDVIAKDITGSNKLVADKAYNLIKNSSNVLSGEKCEFNTELIELLKFSGDTKIRQIRYNTSGKNLDKWSYAMWNTALYDFKKKRFKCDGFEYNAKTGRVSKITFTEI